MVIKKKERNKKERKKESNVLILASNIPAHTSLKPDFRLFNLLAYEHGAPVAQRVKRWLTDLVNRVRSPFEVKSSQP